MNVKLFPCRNWLILASATAMAPMMRETVPAGRPAVYITTVPLILPATTKNNSTYKNVKKKTGIHIDTKNS
jgi:hypothetical protein